ncbi:GrpB family protein [Streptomyces sp. NPDC002553]|uniref:GrpB family protein n=1 Tax=Streptomyces sp. NPDC002553 TaxID=3154417 RepID=UPI00331F1D90
MGPRAALGDAAVRIDHIGSTSVPGLAAKPVIDVQISVAWLDATDAFLGPLTDMGLRVPGGQSRTDQRAGGGTTWRNKHAVLPTGRRFGNFGFHPRVWKL